MINQEDLTKLYYTIGEVADMFGVNSSLVRYWEREFDILKPHRNKKGNRLFTPEDIGNLDIIYHLIKQRGMTISGAKKKLNENRESTINNIEVVKKLEATKKLLLEISNNLEQ